MPDTLRPMSRVDTAWLRTDNDVSPMMIVGVWLLRPGITLAALRMRIDDKLSTYGRVRRAVGSGLIEPLQDGLPGLFAKKATAVVTSLLSPAVPLKLCGATLRPAMYWVPASGDIGIGIGIGIGASILSYGGGVRHGLSGGRIRALPRKGFPPPGRHLRARESRPPWRFGASA